MADARKNFAFTNMLFTKIAHPATKSNNFGLYIQNSKYIFSNFWNCFFLSWSEKEPENSYHEEMEKITQIVESWEFQEYLN